MGYSFEINNAGIKQMFFVGVGHSHGQLSYILLYNDTCTLNIALEMYFYQVLMLR